MGPLQKAEYLCPLPFHSCCDFPSRLLGSGGACFSHRQHFCNSFSIFQFFNFPIFQFSNFSIFQFFNFPIFQFSIPFSTSNLVPSLSVACGLLRLNSTSLKIGVRDALMLFKVYFRVRVRLYYYIVRLWSTQYIIEFIIFIQ